MRAYIVTGTPGTGKTTFAKRFAKEKKIDYVDGKGIVKTFKLAEKYDRKTKSYVVDEKKFAKVCETIIKNAKRSLIIDSHLSHFISKKIVDTCFVTTCDISILEKRLKKRKYDKKKIRDNLDAEIFQVCRIEAKENGHKIKLVKES